MRTNATINTEPADETRHELAQRLLWSFREDAEHLAEEIGRFLDGGDKVPMLIDIRAHFRGMVRLSDALDRIDAARDWSTVDDHLHSTYASVRLGDYDRVAPDERARRRARRYAATAADAADTAQVTVPDEIVEAMTTAATRAILGLGALVQGHEASVEAIAEVAPEVARWTRIRQALLDGEPLDAADASECWGYCTPDVIEAFGSEREAEFLATLAAAGASKEDLAIHAAGPATDEPGRIWADDGASPYGGIDLSGLDDNARYAATYAITADAENLLDGLKDQLDKVQNSNEDNYLTAAADAAGYLRSLGNLLPTLDALAGSTPTVTHAASFHPNAEGPATCARPDLCGPVCTVKRFRLDEVRAIAYEVAGVATSPLLADHPTYVFPAERVGEAVDAVLSKWDPRMGRGEVPDVDLSVGGTDSVKPSDLRPVVLPPVVANAVTIALGYETTSLGAALDDDSPLIDFNSNPGDLFKVRSNAEPIVEFFGVLDQLEWRKHWAEPVTVTVTDAMLVNVLAVVSKQYEGHHGSSISTEDKERFGDDKLVDILAEAKRHLAGLIAEGEPVAA
jgi:hypothetical protein